MLSVPLWSVKTVIFFFYLFVFVMRCMQFFYISHFSVFCVYSYLDENSILEI